MSLDYHTAHGGGNVGCTKGEGAVELGKSGAGGGTPGRLLPLEAPGAAAAPKPRAACGMAARAPLHRTSLPKQSWWNYTLLWRASCNGKVSDYYRLKRRALLFIYFQYRSLEKATRAQNHSFSI